MGIRATEFEADLMAKVLNSVNCFSDDVDSGENDDIKTCLSTTT